VSPRDRRGLEECALEITSEVEKRLAERHQPLVAALRLVEAGLIEQPRGDREREEQDVGDLWRVDPRRHRPRGGDVDHLIQGGQEQDRRLLHAYGLRGRSRSPRKSTEHPYSDVECCLNPALRTFGIGRRLGVSLS
jgi:hypothetical protein